jgi:hypothetical protein
MLFVLKADTKGTSIVELWTILLTAGTSVLAALIGAFTGGWLSRKGEDRKWYRERQLEAYREFLRHYLTIQIGFYRANVDKKPFDYDWAAWGAASMMAQLLAPKPLAAAIGEFHGEVDRYNSHGREELESHNERLGRAQATLLAAIERSLAGKQR